MGIRLDLFEMERYIRTIAERGGLQVQWGAADQCPMTNGKTIYLPRLDPTMSEEKYQDLKHYVVHEVDHCLYTDWNVVERNPSPFDGLLGFFMNMAEDSRIEREGCNVYRGDWMNSNEVQARVIEDILGKMGEGAKKWDTLPEEMRNMMQLVAWGNETFKSIYPSLQDMTERMAAVLKDRTKFDKLMAGTYAEELRNAESTEDVEKIVHRAYREVFEGDPEKECKEAQAKREAEKKDKEKGEGAPEDLCDEWDEEGEGKGKGKDSNGKDKESNEGKRTISYKDLMMDKSEGNRNARHKTKINIKYDDDDYEDASGYHTPRLDEWRVTDYTKMRHIEVRQIAYEPIQELYSKTNPNFAHQVRMLLQIRARSKTRYGQKRGKLQTSAVTRVLSDDPELARRVFKRKIVADTLDTAVCLLVDQSGSMCSPEGHYARFTHAAVAATMMSEVIGNVLHIPTEVLSFTDSGKLESGDGFSQRPYIYIHRKYEEKLVPIERMQRSFAHASGDSMGNNADGDHIIWAHHRLMQQKAKRKVLIVFSDGQPAGGYRGNTAAHTRATVNEIQDRSPVHIIGIGIGSEAGVERLYKDHRVLKSIEHGELERQLLSVIEQSMR